MLSRISIFFQHAKIADIADIGIIAVFIYLILVWLKKARARFMFIGMITLGALYIAARLFGLYLTTVALQAFFAVAVIMIAIIFQEDLRYFFERIAVFGVRRARRTVTPSEENIEIITSALANLSRKKIGALIVVRGSDLLDRHLEAGVMLDSVVSQVLLESIFDRHVPSHDGAVIIDAGRITKLGVFLPLSTNIREIGRSGTRHAAALGITERADALSLVVSEEDGGISVAEEGRIRHLKDVGQLDHTLRDFYHKKFPKKGIRIKRSLTEHSLDKIIAIIIASVLWMTFGQRGESVQRDFVVPIEYRNLTADRIINEPKTKEVTITLSGTEQEFNLLKPGELKLSLDMSAIRDGENRITLSRDLIRNSSGLSVVSIDPADISLNIYKLVPITVPVEVKTAGKPPAGIKISDIRVEPKTMAVMIPSTMAHEKIAITMEPVDLTSVKETTTVTPKLIMLPDIRFPDKAAEPKVVIEVEKKSAGK